MSNETITLVLSGDVFVEDFATAVDGWLELIRGIGSEVAGSEKVQWRIEDLASGSFIGTLKAVYRVADAQPVAEEVVRRFTRLGRDMRSGMISSYSPPIRAGAQKITSVIGQRVTAVRFETDEDDAEIRRPLIAAETAPDPAPVPIGELEQVETVELLSVFRPKSVRHSYGVIRGRVQSISDRHSLRFTLYESLSDRPVSCYVLKGNEEQMRNAWGKIALVGGVVRRDPVSGYPTTIREVQSITVLETKGRGAWREAIGCAPAGPGELSPEAAVRRLRDAE